MINLTPENFETEIQSEGIVFVKFATKNGCKPCADFKPQYELASQNPNGAKFCVYEREALPKGADDLDEIEKKYKIQSFPTVLAFENGELKGNMPRYKFYSDRDLEGMFLDEQKKLYNQKNFVEDIAMEIQARREPQEVTPQPGTKTKK